MQNEHYEYIDGVIKQLKQITKKIRIKRKENIVSIINFNLINRIGNILIFIVINIAITTQLEKNYALIYFIVSTVLVVLLITFLYSSIIIDLDTLNVKIKKYGETVAKGHTGNCINIKIMNVTTRRTSTAGGNYGTSVHSEVIISIKEKEVHIDNKFTSENAQQFKALFMKFFIKPSNNEFVYKHWE